MVFAVKVPLKVGSLVSRIGAASETSTVVSFWPSLSFTLNVGTWRASSWNVGILASPNPAALTVTW